MVSGPTTSPGERRSLAAIAALGLALTVGAVILADARSEQRAVAQMEGISAAMEDAVQAALGNALKDVNALAGLFTASDEVTFSEFERFVERVGHDPASIGVAHLPVVPRSRLSEFWEETGLDPQTLPWHLDAAGNRVPLTDTPSDTPIHPILHYLATEPGAPSLVGFDAGTHPAWRLAIDTAAATRDVAVSRLGALPGTTGAYGFVAVAPVMDPHGVVTGLTASMVDVGAISPPGQALLGGLDWELREAGSSPADQDNPLAQVRTIPVAGRNWYLDVVPTETAGDDLLGDAPAVALAIGTLATTLALLIANQAMGARRTRREERDRRRLTEERDDFLAAISHELRTPLTVVTGIADVLGEATVGADPDIREYVTLLQEGSAELAALVEDLLLVGRLDAQVLEIRPEAVDVRHEVERSVVGVDGRDSRLVVDGDATAWADPLRLRHVVRHLVSDAVRRGGTTVTIRIEATPGAARLVVWDDGPALEGPGTDIFDAAPGRRASEGSPSQLELGLRVARRLAIAMDGNLTHRRLADRNVFVLTLPRVNDAAHHARGPTPEARRQIRLA